MQLSAFLGVLLAEGSIIDLDGTLFVQLGLFAIAFLVLYGLVFKPMVALLEAREDAIDGAKVEAKQLDREIQEKQASFDAELRKVRTSSSEERDRLRQEGQELERSLLATVRAETTDLVSQAKARLEGEAHTAQTELRAQQANLAREIASKVMGREVQG